MKPGFLNLLEPSRPVHPCKGDSFIFTFTSQTKSPNSLSDILYAAFLALKIDFICYILLILACPYACFHYIKSSILGCICQCFCTSHTLASLDAFAKFRKATSSSVMHVSLSARPSVRLHEQLLSYWTNFHKILYFSIFRKSVEKCQVL